MAVLVVVTVDAFRAVAELRRWWSYAVGDLHSVQRYTRDTPEAPSGIFGAAAAQSLLATSISFSLPLSPTFSLTLSSTFSLPFSLNHIILFLTQDSLVSSASSVSTMISYSGKKTDVYTTVLEINVQLISSSLIKLFWCQRRDGLLTYCAAAFIIISSWLANWWSVSN